MSPALPTKEELKHQYNIPNDDFEILTSFPSKEEKDRKKGIFTKLGEHIWSWSIKGIIFAIIWYAPEIESKIEWWYPKVAYSYNMLADYLTVAKESSMYHEGTYIAFLPQQQENQSQVPIPMPDVLPPGTGIYPALEDWHV